MYLIEIDKDELIKEERSGSGWMAISDFMDLYKKHGREGMTVVALTMDYLSPFRHYPLEDQRFKVAMDNVFNSRKPMKYDNPLVKAACAKYKELQWNDDMEQEQIYNAIKARLLKSLSEANTAGDDSEISRINKSLLSTQKSIDAFKDRFDKNAIVMNSSVTEGGYDLSRIEQDIKANKLNSRFEKHGEDFENPGELKLEE